MPLTTCLVDEVPALLQDQADARRQPPAPARPVRPRTPLHHPNDDPAHLAHPANLTDPTEPPHLPTPLQSGMSYEAATAAIQRAMRGRAGRRECALRRHQKEQALRDKEEKHRRAEARALREAEEAEAMRLGTGFKKTIKRTVQLPPRPEEEAHVTVQISVAAVLALKASDMPPEKRQLLKDLFELADEDGTGEIDAKELGELLSKLGDRMTAAEVKEMMDTVDADGSGTITLDELCVMIGPRLNDMEEVQDSDDATAKMEMVIEATEPSYGEIDVEVDEWELEQAEEEAAAGGGEAGGRRREASRAAVGRGQVRCGAPLAQGAQQGDQPDVALIRPRTEGLPHAKVRRGPARRRSTRRCRRRRRGRRSSRRRGGARGEGWHW